MENIIQIAKEYATIEHQKTNHYYGDKDYSHHLQMTVDVANQFIHLIPKEDNDDVIAGCWCHDLIEDTRITYKNIEYKLNKVVAEYSFRLANEKGRNRKERANKKYYDDIKEFKHSSFIKLCDRIANIKYSKDNNILMFNMYAKEFIDFYTNLYDGRWEDLWKKINNLIYF